MWHSLFSLLTDCLSGNRRAASTVSQHVTTDFATSSLRRMRPMTTAILWLGVLEFLIFLFARAQLPGPLLPLGSQLGLIAGLMVLAVMMGRTATAISYGLIGAMYVALITVGSSAASRGVDQMISFVLPALMLIPVAASSLWLTHRQFIFGTVVWAVAGYFALYSVKLSAQESVMLQLYAVMNLAFSTVSHVIFYSLRMQSFTLATSLVIQASLDALTGLPNRRAFLDRASMMLGTPNSAGRRTVALYIDLDKFKNINDSFGHAAGDHALRAVAATLAKHVRTPDLVGRLGGEEFAVVANIDTDGAGLALAQRLKDAIGELDSGICALTISVGLASRAPGEGIESLLQRADAAMLNAKRNGRNRIEQWEQLLERPA